MVHAEPPPTTNFVQLRDYRASASGIGPQGDNVSD